MARESTFYWERGVALGPLARYRIGGPARHLARPNSLAELAATLCAAEPFGYRVLGTGANVLISDAGPQQAITILGDAFDHITLLPNAIEAGARARLPAIAAAARKAGRMGLFFLEAVPGTLGGGLRMNAGSREDWLWDRVEWAEAMTPSGRVERLGPDDVSPSYRRLDLPADQIFVRARISAPEGDPVAVRKAHMSFRTKKVRDQVYDRPSVGSIWKNPAANMSAWQVVDAVGMRGARRGDAQISDHHANFIVNLGTARATDVLNLMEETRDRAGEDLGIALEPEIQLWGFGPDRLARVGAA